MKSMVLAVLLIGLVQPATSQDTTVVRVQPAPVWRNPRLIEELRIGILEGDDHYIFGQISDLEVTSDGSIWVVDRQGPRVRIYDRAGKYTQTVYKVGSGPGEFKAVTGIELTPQRQIAVWDISNNRISLYRETGEHIRGCPVVSGSWQNENLRIDRTGTFWVFTVVQNPACIRRTTARDGTIMEVSSGAPGCSRQAYLRFSAEGIIRDTVFTPVPEERVNQGFVISTQEGLLQPFVPQWHYAVSPLGYFVTAYSSPYAFNLVDAKSPAIGRSAATVTRVESSFNAVKLTSAERAEWEARRAYHAQRQPTGPAASFKVPDTKPAIRSLSVDDDGRIWINRYVAAVKRSDLSVAPAREGGPPGLSWREEPTFDVFDATGRLLGTIIPPRRVRFYVQRGNHIWGVLRGELDENYVVRYRLEPN